MHPYKGDYDCDYGFPKLTERCTAIQQRKEMRAHRVQHLEFCKFKIPDGHLMSGCWTYLSISSLTEQPWDGCEKLIPQKLLMIFEMTRLCDCRTHKDGWWKNEKKRLHLDSCLHNLLWWKNISVSVTVHRSVRKQCRHYGKKRRCI